MRENQVLILSTLADDSQILHFVLSQFIIIFPSNAKTQRFLMAAVFRRY
ncbi:MAG: hypothetical protein ABIH71_05255 [Candidatus Omnitrophota bacterium]